MIPSHRSAHTAARPLRMATRRWPSAMLAALRLPRPVTAPPPPRLIGPLLALAFAVLYVLTYSSTLTSRDGGVMYDTTMAIANRHTLSLPPHHHGIPGVAGGFYSKYGLAQSVAEIPLFVAGQALAPHLPAALPQVGALAVTMLTNPIIMALAVWLFFLLAYALWPHVRGAVCAAVLLGLASPYWPYAKTDFSEPLAALALTGAVLFLVRARARPTALRFALSGLFVALALLTKLTAALAIPAIGLYALYVALTVDPDTALLSGWAVLRRLLAWVAPVLIGVALTADYNLARFGHITATGYSNPDDVPFHAPLLQGLEGLLVSPGKGLLWFCPLVLVALALWPRFLRRRRAEGLLAWGIVLPTLSVFATYPVWWGGVCWGPRYLVPVLPLLLLPLVFLLDALPRVAVARRRVLALIGRRTVLALITLSIFVQFLGVAVRPDRFLTTGVGDSSYLWVPADSPLLSHTWFVAYDVVGLVDQKYAAQMLTNYPWRHPTGTSLSQRINIEGWPYWWWEVLGGYGLSWKKGVALAVILLVLLGAALWPLWHVLRHAEESPYDHWHMAVPAQ